jgi:hypothetical protein
MGEDFPDLSQSCPLTTWLVNEPLRVKNGKFVQHELFRQCKPYGTGDVIARDTDRCTVGGHTAD